MATDPKDLFAALKSADKTPKVAKPDKNLDGLVQDIFEQTKNHRTILLRFYVWYTVVLSALVMALVFLQAGARYWGKDPHIELVPQWALDLIVVGMFGQFIGLLTIVTKRVWDFGSFFEYTKGKDKKK